MTTKAELEKEVETLKTEVEAKAELEKEVEALREEVQSLKDKEPAALSLTDHQKSELVRLADFLKKLYRESQYPPVRQDIKDWREMLTDLASD